MTTPPSSPPPLTDAASHSPSTLKQTKKVTRLRSLAIMPVGAERPLVHMDHATGKADGLHRKKLKTYLGIVARDKVDVTYENWKQVPVTQKNLIWEDIHVFYLNVACCLRDKVDVRYENWKQVPAAQKDLIREDIQVFYLNAACCLLTI